MTSYCLVCGKVNCVSGAIGMSLDHIDWCRCGGVTAMKERLAEAERLLRDIADMDNVDCMLDPTWAKRNAQAFLEGNK